MLGKIFTFLRSYFNYNSSWKKTTKRCLFLCLVLSSFLSSLSVFNFIFSSCFFSSISILPFLLFLSFSFHFFLCSLAVLLSLPSFRLLFFFLAFSFKTNVLPAKLLRGFVHFSTPGASLHSELERDKILPFPTTSTEVFILINRLRRTSYKTCFKLFVTLKNSSDVVRVNSRIYFENLAVRIELLRIGLLKKQMLQSLRRDASFRLDVLPRVRRFIMICY